MYRCYACDAPALMNCECHTQLKLPIVVQDRRVPERVSVASGEDAIPIPKEVDYIE